MSLPIYNVQSAKETVASFFGISTIHVPTTAEVEKVRKDQFEGGKIPTALATATVDEDAQSKKVDDLASALATSGTGSIFFTTKTKYISSSVGSIEFDLVTSEQHEIVTNVCKHPVEKGAPIADHLQPQPGTGRATVFVSNYSLRYASGGAHAGEWNSNTNRALQAFRMFEAIRDAKILVTLVLILKTYTNVAVTHVGAPKDADGGDAVYFDVEFQEVRTVTLKHQTISATCKPADMNSAGSRRASNTVSRGRVNPDTVDMDATSDIAP